MKRLAMMFAAALLAATPSLAVDVTLTACPSTATFNGNPAVSMWGYVLGNVTPCPAAWSVGPTIQVPPGDTLLRITLYNRLTVPTSVMVPGLSSASTPVFFTDGQGRRRVRSLAAETPAGGSGVYSFVARPGTYLYHSGTQMQVQVQMGLYGAVTQVSSAGVAYPAAGANPAVAFSDEVVVLHSEVDPGLHGAVAAGTYGTGAYTSTFNYKPKYFLLNGKSYTAGDPPLNLTQLDTGQPVLLRFLSAALDTHTPALVKGTMSLVAEDGNRYPMPRVQHEASLVALKTLDAVWIPPANGDYMIYDRSLGLSNLGKVGGGMYGLLRVGTAVVNQPPVAVDDVSSATAGGTAVLISVLANDTDPDSGPSPLSIQAVGTASCGSAAIAGSQISFTPPATVPAGNVCTFDYTVTDGAASDIGAVTVTINAATVNQPPVANPDTANTAAGAPAFNINVLANDTDTDGPAPMTLIAPLTVVTAGCGSATINTNQVRYTPPLTAPGVPCIITYTVQDGLAASSTGTLTVTVSANRAPVAVNDGPVVIARGTTVRIDVLLNDSDPDGNLSLNWLRLVTKPNSTVGEAKIVVSGGRAYFDMVVKSTAPVGPASFTYQVRDSLSVLSNIATVSITVQ